MSELKPCIRCGGHMSWNDNEFESAYVCDDCHYFVEWDGTPEEFVKWWNTRPIEDALNARIAELEAFVERMIEVGDRLSDEVDHPEFCATYSQCDWSIIVAEWRVKHPNPREAQQ